MTLRRRIVLTVLPLVLLLAGLGGTGAALLVRLGQRSDAILRENYDSVRAMDRLNEAVAKVDRSFWTGSRKEFDEGWAEIDTQLTIEKNNITILPEEPRLVTDLESLLANYRTKGTEFFGVDPGNVKRIQLRDGHLAEVRIAVIDRTNAIRDLNENQMQLASRDAQDTARRSALGFGIGLAVSILLAAVAIWWLQRTILGPIRAVTDAASAIGGGQLHRLVPVQSRDEIGRLAESFNTMTEKLRAYRQSDTESLLRARQTGQATIDSFPDPVVVIDTLGRIELANPAAQRLLGVQPPRDGEPLAFWTPPESLRQPVEDALRQQRAVVMESFDQTATFRLDGEERSYLPQVRPIRSPAGELLGAAVVLFDVTRFRLLNQLKSDWVATVSHELKTPLTSVRLAVHVLLEEIVGPLEPKQVELLIEARESTERLLKLIEHLLALAKLEDGRDELVLRPTDPSEFLRTVAEEVAARAEDKRIEIVVETAPDLPRIEVDADRLGRALNNLLDNAITYTEPGGRVTLAASVVDGRVHLSVSDTGIGIPPEFLPHVFERFFRVPGRDQQPGTGLGLAIVRDIVLAHSGEILCESEVGKGTTFRITVPNA